ncbi:LOW QUALITY PROTEIN: hypothetical protein RJ640_015564 [Escallonia rubra]|uniref:60S acidic ribosomal protein P1 n=1 Tax=Escallonia rubra TaxID=112253 RepID=A0AA88UBZ6_9ASTE|nr:LOW QUALITY PROTEIN: hypothetical protein RJ640_015564 [Escallonia rubra]
MSSVGELACTYACLALHDDGIPVTAEKITTMLKVANVTVESYWPMLFAKLVQDIDDLILNAGLAGNTASAAASTGGVVSAAATAEELAAEDKEEIKEESDEEIFSLFDD